MTDLELNIRNCKSLREMFDYINEHYQTEKELRTIAKNIIAAKVDLLLSIGEIKKK